MYELLILMRLYLRIKKPSDEGAIHQHYTRDHVKTRVFNLNVISHLYSAHWCLTYIYIYINSYSGLTVLDSASVSLYVP